MAEVAILEKWTNLMLDTISTNGFGPTVTARFQYLMSTIFYYSFVTFKNNKTNSLKEPELKYLSMNTTNVNSVDKVIQQGVLYLFVKQNLKTDNVPVVNFNLGSRANTILNNLKLFLDRRDNDNYKVASAPVPIEKFPNQNLFIEVDNKTQDLSNLDAHTWTPLKHGTGATAKTQKYLTPYWGNVLPVEGITLDKYMEIADENYNVPNKDLNRQIEIQEVLKAYENLNDVQRMIAEYFQGGKVTPPGIWNVIALYTFKSTNMSALNSTRFLYLLNSSMFMSSVVAWGVKLKYMQARPIQEIRMSGLNEVTTFDGSVVNCKAWKTFQQQNFQTPPFPDYISGHSTFSSAAATVFEQYFPNFESIQFLPFSSYHGGLITQLLENNDYINTVDVAMLRNSSSTVVHTDSNLRFPTCAVKLTFTSWRDLANLSGISRIYGGIHGNNANFAGLIIGECIAKDVLARPMTVNRELKPLNNSVKTNKLCKSIKKNIVKMKN
jgi:hypothetical protein